MGCDGNLQRFWGCRPTPPRRRSSRSTPRRTRARTAPPYLPLQPVRTACHRLSSLFNLHFPANIILAASMHMELQSACMVFLNSVAMLIANASTKLGKVNSMVEPVKRRSDQHLELVYVKAIAKRCEGLRDRASVSSEVRYPQNDGGAHPVRPEQAEVPRHLRAPVVPNHEHLQIHHPYMADCGAHSPRGRGSVTHGERNKSTAGTKKEKKRKGGTFVSWRWSRSATKSPTMWRME